MVKVVRKDPYGGIGYKSFPDEKSAAQWLNSDSVKQDIGDGFTFRLVKQPDTQEKDGG